MATTTTTLTKPTTPTTPTATAPLPSLKKSGPPVPPRPQHTLAAASLLKAQRESAKQQRPNGVTTTTTSSTTNAKITVSAASATSEVAGSGVGAGRTIIYKSPSINLEKKPAEREKRSVGVGRTMSAPKPPLKLRKAPGVPVPKPKPNQLESATTDTSKSPATDSNNIIIVQSSNSVSLSRHNSMGSPKSLGLRDPRLSLDGKIAAPIQLEQLKPSQPLPRPRKIVKVPVATLDVDDVESSVSSVSNATNNTASSSIFRRSKTTLDNLASRANITTISTVSASNSFLGGKTVEIKNNLKNAAERLFSEIIVNQQQKQTAAEPATIITKHERAIQHQAVLELDRQSKPVELQQPDTQQACKVTVVTSAPQPTPNLTPSKTSNNCTRININASATTSPMKSESIQKQKIDVNSGTTEKKIAFHEMLISELTAMRAKSSSMEALSTKSSQSVNLAESLAKPTPPTSPRRQAGKAVAVAVTDSEDVDADNVEDDIDDDDLTKRMKAVANSTPRKRCPSGCSSDSSPYGTERSSRIRTSDWIEVGDNGKKVTMSSCHISLEDSGLEDEERLSSSGVGDSWDSVKEVENEKRARSVQRAMSITELPPLPKSLSGFNKLLGSDSGLLSDNEARRDKNSNELESPKDLNGTLSDDNDNANNNNKNPNKNENNDSGLDSTFNQSAKESDNANQTTGSPTAANRAPSASSTLDKQLATLKKEMYGLRQLDLSLLSQLWALNDSIQEFRTILQEQEDDDSYSPHSPSPSSYDSVSSDGEDEVIIAKQKMLGARPKIITTQPKLLVNKANELNELQSNQRLKVSNTEAVNNTLKASQKPQAPLPKPHVLPRMRSAPPPPPPALKTQSPARQT